MANPEPSVILPGAFNNFHHITDPRCGIGSMTPVFFRDHARVALSILTLCALAWAYLVYLASAMPPMDSQAISMSMAMPTNHEWELGDVTAMFLMWSVMMIAMMLPSATPMILLYEKVYQKRGSQGSTVGRVTIFAGGYLLIWIGFSVFATLLNWVLHSAGLLTSMMGRVAPIYAGAALIAAGTYQWTSLKYACLTHCRSPIGFLMTHWREGHRGSLRLGVDHGIYCLGCCWLLMALLFVLGVMNLLWIAALSALVLAEKTVPSGHVLSRIAGVAMICWGIWIVFSAALAS